MGNFLKNIHPLLRRGKHNDVYDDSNFAVLNALNYELTLAERETIESKIQSSLETATGEYLDEWGDWFGVYRKDGWSDDYYRKRIIRELLLKRGTIPAIIDAIKDFLEDNDANISIYEPWRNIFYTNKSKLNGEDHLMGYYYRFAIIDITIDRPFSPAIIEVIKAFKPAGVLFYLRLDTSLNPNNVPVDSPYVYLDVTNKTELEQWVGLTYDIKGNINLSNSNKTMIDDNIFYTNKSNLNGTDVLAGAFNHGRGYLHLASGVTTESFTPTKNTMLSEVKLLLGEASQDMYVATNNIDNRSAQIEVPMFPNTSLTKYKYAWANSSNGQTDFTIVYPPNNLLNGTKDFSLGAIRPEDIQQETFRGNAVLINKTPTSSYRDTYRLVVSEITTKDYYTLGFYAKADNNEEKCRCYFYNPNTTGSYVTSQGVTGSAVDGNVVFTLSTEWEYYWVTWKQGVPNQAKTIIMCRQNSTEGIGNLYFSSPMFVEGQIAVPWRSSLADNDPDTHDMKYIGVSTKESNNPEDYTWYSTTYSPAYTYMVFDIQSFVISNYNQEYRILQESLSASEALNVLLSNPVVSNRIKALVSPSSPINYSVSLYDFYSNRWDVLGSSTLDTNYRKSNMQFNRAIDYINDQGLLFIQMEFTRKNDNVLVELDMLNLTFNYRMGAGYSIGLQSEVIGGTEIPATGIIANPKSVILDIGEQFLLGATLIPENATVNNVEYTSNNPQIASVSAEGLITPVSVGTTVITVYGDDRRVYDTCEVTVVIRPTAIDFDKDTITLESRKVPNPNLLRGVFYNKPETVTATNNYFYTYVEPVIQRRVALKPSTTYTLSWKYQYVSGTQPVTVSVGLGRADSSFSVDMSPQVNATTEKLTFTTPKAISNNPFFAFRLNRTSAIQTVKAVGTYTNLKLEEGSIATPWVPNVEDNLPANIISITEAIAKSNTAGNYITKNFAKRSIDVVSNKVAYGGLHYPVIQKLKPNTNYILGFQISYSSGTLSTIGGHPLDIANVSSITIDNIEQTTNGNGRNLWDAGVPYNFEQNKVYNIRMCFSTNLLTTEGKHGVFIQPNRLISASSSVTFTVTNVYLIKNSVDTGWLPAIEDGTF